MEDGKEKSSSTLEQPNVLQRSPTGSTVIVVKEDAFPDSKPADDHSKSFTNHVSSETDFANVLLQLRSSDSVDANRVGCVIVIIVLSLSESSKFKFIDQFIGNENESRETIFRCVV